MPIESAQVRREVERAISKGMIVLPFRVEDVKPAGAMEFALSNTHWLDGFTPPVERQMELLAKSVERYSERIVGRWLSLQRRRLSPPHPSPPACRRRSGWQSLTVIIVAGSFWIFFDKTAKPVGRTAPKPVGATASEPVGGRPSRSDQERLQGNWEVVNETFTDAKTFDPRKFFATDEIWTFQGNELAFPAKPLSPLNGLGGSGSGSYRGTFALRDGEFDFRGTDPDGAPAEFLGIYKFEGEFLEICFRFTWFDV